MSNELEPIQHLDNKIKDIASQIINEDNVDKTINLVKFSLLSVASETNKLTPS